MSQQLFIFFAVLLQVFHLSCASTPRTKSAIEEGKQSPSTSESTLEQSNNQTRITPITLVLGPGLAKGYAHIGVLRALEKNKIPIGAIVGVEMGALVGGAYAVSRSFNQFEWLVYKVREDLFKDTGVNLTRIFGASTSGDRLNQTLEKIFSNETIDKVRIPFRTEGVWSGSSELITFERERLSLAVRAALALPGFIRPLDLEDGRKVESSAALRPYPIETAKALSVGPVVVVDLIQDGISESTGIQSPEETKYQKWIQTGRTQAIAELEQADLILRPSLSNVGFWSFSKKSLASFAGEKIVLTHLEELRNITGMDAQP